MKRDLALIAAIVIFGYFAVREIFPQLRLTFDQIFRWVWFFATWAVVIGAAILAIAILFRWLQTASQINGYKLRRWTIDELHQEIGYVQAQENPIEKTRFPSPIKSAYLYFQHQKEAWLAGTLQHMVQNQNPPDPVATIASKIAEIERLTRAWAEMKKNHPPQDHPWIDRMFKTEIDRLKEQS